MNREVKYRGKDLENGNCWRYGSLVVYPDGNRVIVEFDKDENELSYDVYPETVGQFAGKYDKNGKEIYEGDLIKSPSGLVYTVIFGTWVHDEKKEFPKIIDKYEHTGWCISLDGNTPCELLDSEVYSGVITGNVHDNPSLLKVNSAGNI